MKILKIVFVFVVLFAAAVLILTLFFADNLNDHISEDHIDEQPVMVYPGMDGANSVDGWDSSEGLDSEETPHTTADDINVWVQRSIILIAVTLAVMFLVMTVTMTLSSRTEGKLVTAETKVSDVTILCDSYSRFVPIEMFKLLNRESVLEVTAGNGATVNAALLELRIHGEYDGEDFFRYLNVFFERVTPCITQNGGIIERHADNGLTAIFAGGAEYALKAAVGLGGKCTAVISNERVSVGIIGYDRRISMGIVSRHSLKKLAELGEKMGCSVILTDGGGSLNSRLLGYAGGRAVYDVFEYDTPELKKGKLDTQRTFERAVALYHDADFHGARNGFIEVIKRSPLDLAAREYLLLSDKHYMSGAKEFTSLLGALYERVG